MLRAAAARELLMLLRGKQCVYTRFQAGVGGRVGAGSKDLLRLCTHGAGGQAGAAASRLAMLMCSCLTDGQMWPCVTLDVCIVDALACQCCKVCPVKAPGTWPARPFLRVAGSV